VQTEPRQLLVVEDDAGAQRQLRWAFDDYDVTIAGDRASALAAVAESRFPVVLLDMGLPPDAEGASEGLRALPEILALAPATKVIVVTGREEREVALEAVAQGATDFYRKPVDTDELRILVSRACRLFDLEEENRRLAKGTRARLPGIVASSDAMFEVCEKVRRAADSRINVLLVGESGTGKELLSRALHQLSPRAEGPFVAINCAAIPEQLLESELFGHERGAFTGAVKSSAGRLALANRGTLLLDEIGDMPLVLQSKLLRFLEDRSIQRVGGRADIEIDARIVSATHQPLLELLAQGRFREDLYYRIAELSIEVAPLRERPEDAVLLAQHFFERHRDEASRPLRGMTAEALSAIARHPWPGNVRMLENRVKRAILLSDGPRLSAVDLELDGGEDRDEALDLKTSLERVERELVSRAWAASGGNVSKTGQLLGVSRPTAYKLLRDYQLKE
jgi:two-component system NtrC family response regulator